MKILTKEEEQEHYNATVKGGLLGGGIGLSAGALGVVAASRRYPAFRSLTLPFRAFLMVSTSTFAAIVSADSYSRRYEASRHPETRYTDAQTRTAEAAELQKTSMQRAKDWATENKYGIVFGSWVVSMGAAFGIVGRNKYLTGQQKLVQARVYAQGLTLAVIVASLALEGRDMKGGAGRWETVKVLDPNDPTHQHLIEKKVHHERYQGEDQWMDMVAAEEERIKDRKESVKEHDDKKSKKSKDSDDDNSDEKDKSKGSDDDKSDDKKKSKESKDDKSDDKKKSKSK